MAVSYSELQRNLGLQSNSYVNTTVRELIQEGFLTQGKQGAFKLTWKGFFDIFPFVLPKLLLVFLILVSASLCAYVGVSYALQFQIQRYYILAMSSVALAFGIFAFALQNRVEEVLLRRD